MMRRTSIGFLAAILGAMCLASPACTPSTPTPFLASTAGAPQTVYTGSVTDSVTGSGTINVSLVNVEGLVSGTWDMSFDGKSSARRYVSGTQSGASYSASVSVCPETDQNSGCSSCRWQFSGTLTAATLTGTYTQASTSCQAESGNVSASH
jgi:hypothetical protein